jgi:hypothetical protein
LKLSDNGEREYMMKTPNVILLLAWTGACVPGCISSQETTITLLGIKSDAAINQPPVFVTENPRSGRLDISGGFSISGGGDYRGQLRDTSGVPSAQVGPLFTPGVGNVRWTPAEGMAAFNLQYMLSSSFAFTGGFNYAWGKRQDAWGGNLGLGLVTSTAKTAFRLDAGVMIRQISQNALTMVHTRTTSVFGGVSEQTGVFLDHTQSTAADFYASMTLNTCNPASPADFFFNLAISQQSLASFTPRDQLHITPFTGVISVVDQRSDLDATLFLFTPGVVFRAGEQQQIIVGARMVGNFASEELESTIRWVPFVQVSFTLAPGNE